MAERNGTSEPTRVAIVPHTHWDREWYEPFQTLRVRLVHLVDELLDLLEHDVSYRRFLLDGQTVVVDDYLAIRPEAAPRLARLANSGRLQLGPWMVLMDEFMVSGETIVRDLQAGLTRASELGGVMRVGYLPDMFGHIAQMPQILQLAGLEHAVVWRGVPSTIDPDRVRLGRARRLPRARRVPLRLVLERPRPPRRREATHRPRPRLRARAGCDPPPGRRRPAHERHRPPAPAAVARAGRRRGERDAGRLPTSRSRRSTSTCRASRRTTSRNGPANCAPARAPTSSWAWRRTASTSTRPRRSRSERWSVAPNL